jgi:TatA/E family protein of Tat protein translocase
MPTPGPLELVIILVIALLVLGPGKLPDVGAALGKSIKEFRKASSDVQDAVKLDIDTSPLPNTPAAATPAAPIAAPPVAEPAAQPAPAADAAPADPSDPTQTASVRSTNAADSPITAG